MKTYSSSFAYAFACASLIAVGGGCGSPPATDVCAGHTGSCVDLTVISSTVTAIDELRFDASGAATGVRSSSLGRSTALPVHVAVRFPAGAAGTLRLLVAGLNGGAVVGQGIVNTTLVADQRASLTVELTAPVDADMNAPDDLVSADLRPPPDLGPVCAAGTFGACLNANDIERCRTDEMGYETVTCPRGCNTGPTPHCAIVVPTGIAPPTDFATMGLMDVTLVNAILHTDTGQIETGVRAASPNPSMLSVTSGIGYHVVTGTGGYNVGVFVFDKLTVTGTLTIVGNHTAVLLARGDVTIAKINAAPDCTMNRPGPGGFAGGTPAAAIGLGPGGGKAGFSSTFKGGGGGGGHGGTGGVGATVSTGTGGAGGASYDVAILANLRGGSGGGASTGGTATAGAGGGAVQIVSQTRISITEGIAAGGCGGQGKSDNSCGGGGAGGAILLEAPTVSVANMGYLVVGGGGGGGSMNGNNAGNSALEVSVGLGGFCGTSRCGGQGAYSAQVNGSGGTADGMTPGCGGGGTGRIRLNTLTGAATLGMSGNLYVPTIASGLFFTQGVVTIQ